MSCKNQRFTNTTPKKSKGMSANCVMNELRWSVINLWHNSFPQMPEEKEKQNCLKGETTF